MDSITSEVRKSQWTNIVTACQARPAGMTAKQWLAENGIREKAYYYWQRKLRKEAYTQMNAIDLEEQGLLPVPQQESPVAFAELPFSASDSSGTETQKACHHPVAAIQLKNAQIMISNDLSVDLLRCIMQEAAHA